MESICLALRAWSTSKGKEGRAADKELVDRLEAEIDGYRDGLGGFRAKEAFDALTEPPGDLRELLWLAGWMIYEASLQLLDATRATDGSEIVVAPADLIRRLRHLAEYLPWPHFAPRALGAIRADALVASKRDTTQGYREASLLHEQARRRHDDYVRVHGAEPGRERELLGLQEIFLQLVLSETGTVCRATEQIVGRWLDELEKDDPDWAAEDEDRSIRLMYEQLSVGVTLGERALATAAEITRKYGLVKAVNRERLAMRTAPRNPAIMTARAALHLLTISYEMEELTDHPGYGHDDWARMREATIERFRAAYAMIEKPVHDEHGNLLELPLSSPHERSVVQLRLNAALLVPGLDLPAGPDADGYPARNPLDDQAVEELSAWLAATGSNGRIRGNANAIGAATMPAYIRGVEACQADHGASTGYRDWRTRWFALDRYLDEDEEGRRRRVWQAMGR
ncbi:hypothetical protein PSN13_01422 [Micromonospora saelicesensis]|uniref:Uncharacterized protein n=1 Tax=Micromonospora saelicesensis TaxID=285676 RepID=A0A328NZP5_9ACTN|nr:hypothetical protein [Micromonospora saelicesensis]RAO37440.1 hypothetical protein PSN13_01422 [Micromonospora saelicesensis]